MPVNNLFFLSIPGLRLGDVDEITTPTLHRWVNGGTSAELVPTFPCVTSSVQASMWTGVGPGTHGVIANGFYDRKKKSVEFWVARNDVIGGEQIWEALQTKRPELTSAVWHAQNIKGAAANFICTPAPIHKVDGTTELWCYTKPKGLYEQLISDLGHFPLQHYWGPLANIESTRWILNAAGWLTEKHAPNFHWIYLPHLDYAAQKFGPNSEQAKNSLKELDAELAVFADRVMCLPAGEDCAFLIAGEYALTDVSHVVFPNRVLREVGLLGVSTDGAVEVPDLIDSAAFAMVDHQLAHIYVEGGNAGAIERCCRVFSEQEGVAAVYAGADRDAIGMNHSRCGDVILVAEEDTWFAYYWWLDDSAAPPFARTVDIHRKPGYDPVELFFDPATKSIPIDATLVKGSHGAPAIGAHQRTALICSRTSSAFRAGESYRDTDIKRMVLELMTV